MKKILLILLISTFCFGSKLYYKQNVTASVTSLSSTFAYATGYQITIPKDGLYKITLWTSIVAKDSDSTNSDVRLYLYNETSGVKLGNTFSGAFYNLAADDTIIFPTYYEDIFKLKKGDTIRLYVKEESGDDASLEYGASAREPYIAYEEL